MTKQCLLLVLTGKAVRWEKPKVIQKFKIGVAGFILAALIGTPVIGAPKLINFGSENMTYPSVRVLLMKQGWKPVSIPGTAGCSQPDSCSGFPETAFCAGTGAAPCMYTWKRGKELMMVWGHGEGVQTSVEGERCKAFVQDHDAVDCKK